MEAMKLTIFVGINVKDDGSLEDKIAILTDADDEEDFARKLENITERGVEIIGTIENTSDIPGEINYIFKDHDIKFKKFKKNS